MTNGGVAAAVVLARKHRSAATRANEKPKAVRVDSTSDLLVELTHTVLKAIERRRAYLELFLFLVFTLVYIVVLSMQRNTHLSYQVEESHRSAFFNLATSTQSYDDGRIEIDIPSTDAFYSWLKDNVISSSWADPQCGDGICQSPIEFQSFANGRFGCSVDCGVFTNLTNVMFNFTLDFDNSLKDDDGEFDEILAEIKWDVCSDSYGVCIAENAASQATFASGNLNASVTYALPDGDWRLVFETPIGQVGGNVTYTVGGATTVLVDFERCEEDGPGTIASFDTWRAKGGYCPFVDPRDFGGDDDDGAGDDDDPFGGGGPGGPPADDDPFGGGGDDDDDPMGPPPPPGSASATPSATASPTATPSASATPSPSAPPRCPDHCTPHLGDNCCTLLVECYSELCGWDGGDCCAPIQANIGRKNFRFTLNQFGVGAPEELFPEAGTIRRNIAGPPNIIVGGVLLVQKRKMNAGCVNVGRFTDLYDHCKSSADSVAPFGIDPVFLSTASLYDLRESSSDYYNSSELDAAGLPYGFRYHKSPHDDADSGYPVFWDVNLNQNRAEQIITYLKEGFFIDSQTDTITVQTVTFNGESGTMTRSEIEFTFDTEGTIFMKQIIDGVIVEVYGSQDTSSVSSDTVDVGPARSEMDTRTLRAALEIFLVVALVFETLVFVYRAIKAPSRQMSVLKHLFSLWTLVELVHLILLFVSVGLWLKFWDSHARTFSPRSRYEGLTDRAHSNSPTAPARMLEPGEEYDDVLKMFADMRSMVEAREAYFSIAGVCVIFLILRLLSYLHFQPRMGLVSRTIERAGQDIAHFLVLFLLVLLGYAVAGHLLFGSRVFLFSTLGRSLVTCMEILLGEIDVNTDLMMNDNRLAAVIWFWSLTVVLFLILLNVFLAILLDAFIEIKRHASESQTMPQELLDISKELLTSARRPDVTYTRSDGQTTSTHTAPYMNDEELIEALFDWSKTHRTGRQLLTALGLMSFLSIPRSPQAQRGYEQPASPPLELAAKDGGVSTGARIHPVEPSAPVAPDQKDDDLALSSIRTEADPNSGAGAGSSMAPAAQKADPGVVVSSTAATAAFVGGGGNGAAQPSRDFFATVARIAGFVPPGETVEGLTPLSKLPPLFGWTDLEYRIFANYSARFPSAARASGDEDGDEEDSSK